MGSLVKSSLSALSSERADICPVGVTLKQFQRTFNGNFTINFINALSGSQSFKKLNFSNFYLSNNILLDNVINYTPAGGGRLNSTGSSRILGDKFFTTLNFAEAGEEYLRFKRASKIPFRETNDTYNAQFYGAPKITRYAASANNFEVTILDGFTLRIAYLLNNFRFYLVVSDDDEENNQRKALFVGENKIPLSASNLEYNFSSHGENTYLNLYTTKQDSAENKTKYILESTGTDLVANKISLTDYINEFFVSQRNIKLNQQTNLTIPSPYNTSFVTYNIDQDGVNNTKSDFKLPSNYLLYSSSDEIKQNFNLFNLKNIANNQDEFTSCNNLLSTSSSPVFVQDLRKYTSIFSDIDSEKNEVLALNYVYNNFDVTCKPGTTYFTTPSSLKPFKRININDTKLVDCGSFAFTQPYLADRVYRLDDDTVKSEDVTYLCTWLSGGIGKRGLWVDRYYYPDLVTKSTALSAKGTYNATYDSVVENLILTNSNLKTSVTKTQYFDKKSDLIFEINKRYKYERITKEAISAKLPTNFCGAKKLREDISNYFIDINNKGGFAIGFNIQNNTKNFSIKSARNDIDGGFEIIKQDNLITFTFKIFDNSNSVFKSDILGQSPTTDTTDFTHAFKIDEFAKNSIFLSFNAILGTCNLYLNSQNIFSFNLNTYQMIGKSILFGNIYLFETNRQIEILQNDITDRLGIENLYLALEPLDKEEELAVIFNQVYDEIQAVTISLPCGMRNLTDTITTVNSINTNLKHKSNMVDINVKNLNIKEESITDEIKNILLADVITKIPKTTTINNINFVNYK